MRECPTIYMANIKYSSVEKTEAIASSVSFSRHIVSPLSLSLSFFLSLLKQGDPLHELFCQVSFF